MDLIARGTVRRTHRAGVELAAVAVVIAHLDGLVVTAPFAPVEHRGRYVSAVARLEAKQRSVVHLRRLDDLAGIHQAARIEPGLDLAERARQARAEEGRDPFRAHQAV